MEHDKTQDGSSPDKTKCGPGKFRRGTEEVAMQNVSEFEKAFWQFSGKVNQAASPRCDVTASDEQMKPAAMPMHMQPQERRPQVVQPCRRVGATANQVHTGTSGNNLKEAAEAPAVIDKTLTISLDNLLVGTSRRSKQNATAVRSDTESWSADAKTNMMHMPAYGNEHRVLKPRNATGKTASQMKPAKEQESKKFKRGAGTAAPSEGGTTLMMSGIPCGFSQEALMSLIDDAGLYAKYNFFYLPIDSMKSANLGYAFINFVDVQSAEYCTSAFKGVQLAPYRSAKTCRIRPASIQGLANLREHFKDTAVSRDGRGPMFFNCY
jgi:hypothetical protein